LLRSTIARVKVLYVLIGMAEAAILPFMALLLAERGFTPAGIGLVLALMSLAAFVASPLWGYTADRWRSAERTLQMGASATVALAALFPAATGRLLLAVLSVALWVARAPLAPLMDAIALSRLGEAHRSAYGGVRLWMSIGWSVAVIGWGALLTVGIELVPVLYGSTILLVALWVRFGLGVGDRRAAAADLSLGRTWRRRPLALAVAPAGLVSFLVSLLLLNAAFSATWNFLALRINGLGGGVLLIGVAASLQAVTEVPTMALSGRLAKLVDHRGLFAAGCAIHLAVFIAWSLLSSPLLISLVKLVIGVGFALTYVGTVVIVDDLVPKPLRATGQGLAKAVAFGLAPVVGTLGGGLLYGLLGPRPLFLTAAAAAAAAGVIVWFASPEPRKPGRPRRLRWAGRSRVGSEAKHHDPTGECS